MNDLFNLCCRLAQPIRLLQADELKVSCTYDSTSMSRTVSFGDEISVSSAFKCSVGIICGEIVSAPAFLS